MPNTTFYTPNGSPKATLLIVHGMAEHQQRYSDFAQFLANHGFVVMTFDHLGHGKRGKEETSEGHQPEHQQGQQQANQAQLGYIGNPKPHQQMISDVIDHATILAQAYPNVAHFILGHSMGSFITRCVLQTYGDNFDGAIIMGTSPPKAIVIPLIPLSRMLNAIAPHRTNEVLGLLINKTNNAPFHQEPNLQNFNWLSQNPKQVRAYINDPLCGFTFTNNGFYALFSLIQQGVQAKWAKNVPKNLPLLFVSGKQDSIGNMGKGIPQIITALQRQNFTDITVHQYDGMRHDILHEDGYKTVYDDILNWLMSR